MGKFGKKNKGGRPNKWQQGDQRDQRDQQDNPEARAKAWELTAKISAAFEKYYKSQNLVPDEDWDEFMTALRTPLPTTFRVTGFKTEAKEVLKIIKSDYLNKIVKAESDDNVIQRIPWYPDELAWQINCSRKEIRHSEDLKKLHDFLVAETNAGMISRQEAVSMIPPLLLDVKPHHKVFDMCAAPGSKTAQLVELIHRNEGELVPEGLVIANDSDNKRCYLMVHQIKRLDSANFIIVNHNAAFMPNFYMGEQDADDKTKNVLLFDRILADVPCSGDGTLRKNVDIWKKWNPNAAANLHNIQQKILRRGLEMLEVGGRIAYSTCSLNPVEDEAVVASILQECEDSVNLVDISKDLPGLKYKEGLNTWKVCFKDGKLFSNFEEVPDEQCYKGVARRSQFPPAADVVEKLDLDRCIRILPHLQNTGGFFVAIMEKTGRLPWQSKRKDPEWQEAQKDKQSKRDTKEANGAQIAQGTAADKDGEKVTEDQPEVTDGQDTNNKDSTQGNQVTTDNAQKDKDTAQKKRDQPEDGKETNAAGEKPPPAKKAKLQLQLQGYKEDPFIFLTTEHPVLEGIRSFFGISEEFPVTQMLVRCDTDKGQARNLYFTSSMVKHIVECNKDRIKFINLGVKVFSRSRSSQSETVGEDVSEFRLSQEGVHIVATHLKHRRVLVSKKDIVVLLSTECPFVSRLSEETQEKIGHLGIGGLLFSYTPDPSDHDGPQCSLNFCGWRGKVSCRCYMPSHDRAHFLRLFGHEMKSKAEKKEEQLAREKDNMYGEMKQEDLEFNYIANNKDQDSEMKAEDETPQEETDSTASQQQVEADKKVEADLKTDQDSQTKKVDTEKSLDTESQNVTSK
eukprot:GHVU01143434.1.p1 GENE.GHVU01143434.1~~GHVU01143434.1.p1  ORF type:complete len:849 (+),score=142.06 GHVU01143434.1:201-2747(+)